MSGRPAGPPTGVVVRLVAGREIRERLRTRSFYVVTGLLVVIILALGVASRIAGDDGPSVLELGVAGAAPEGTVAAVEGAGATLDRPVEVRELDSVASGRAALEDGDVDALLDAERGELVVAGEADDEALFVLQQAWADVEVRAALADLGLAPDQVQGALSSEPLAVVNLDGDADDETSGLAVLAGTAAGILLFIALQTFGTYVLMGVVEEKSTAVVEVLLVRARADQMLAGKVVGIGVTAMIQLTATVAAAVGALALSGVDVPGEIWSAVPMTLLWFLGGYALYSTLFALAGSLVSRQEEAQSAAAPIMWTLIAAYLLIFLFGYVPDSTASTVLSLLPPIAPLLMPMRMAAGAASVVEVVAALVLLAATTWLAWRLAARIYEQVLLRRGSRITWRTALRLLRG